MNKFDQYMLTSHFKLVEKWQDITGKSKSDLETMVYLGSSLTLGASYATNNSIPTGLLAGMAAMNSIWERIRPKKPTNTYLICNSLIYGLSLVQLTMGIGALAMGIKTNEFEYYNNAMRSITQSIGMMGLASGDYISMLPEPPKRKKSLYEKAKEKLKALVPRPAPVPVPANNLGVMYSYMQNRI